MSAHLLSHVVFDELHAAAGGDVVGIGHVEGGGGGEACHEGKGGYGRRQGGGGCGLQSPRAEGAGHSMAHADFLLMHYTLAFDVKALGEAGIPALQQTAGGAVAPAAEELKLRPCCTARESDGAH